MFTRGTDYEMQMDVEVNDQLIEQLIRERGVDPDAARTYAVDAFIRHVISAAKGAVRENGLKWRGAEVDKSGAFPRFSVRFRGADRKDAEVALAHWDIEVQALGGAQRVLAMSLRGTDGTDERYFDKDYEREMQAEFAKLPSEMQNEIDRLMDPDGNA